jgi:hypothetical protein
LQAIESGTLRSPDGTEVVEVIAGKTRIAPCHWLLRSRPEWFQVTDKRDIRTTRDHARARHHTRQELEREHRLERAPRRQAATPLRLALRLPHTGLRLRTRDDRALRP